MNIKSRSHSLVISNMRLKRVSGDFPLAGERVPGPVHRHPFSSPEVSIPSLSKRDCIFSDVFVVVLLKGTSAGRCECEYAKVLKKQGLAGRLLNVYTAHTAGDCIACFEISRECNSGFSIPR